jgi:hypothetical protein
MPIITTCNLSAVLVQKRENPSGDANNDNSGFDSRSASLRKKLNALKSPAVVFGVFFVSWAPHFLMYCLQDLEVLFFFIYLRILYRIILV